MSSDPRQTWVMIRTQKSLIMLLNLFSLIEFRTALIAIAVKKTSYGIPARSKDVFMQVNDTITINRSVLGSNASHLSPI